jgi:MoaA/NifB/PqqE/SkfB family radical SAM enzyme
MKSNEFAEKYLSDFEILDLIDLHSVSVSPESAYQTFQKLYQTSYTNNQRLIFYSQYTIPKSLLTHLYNAAFDIDISNFFIIIACPGANDIITKTGQVTSAVLFTGIDVAVDSVNLENRYTLSSTICPQLWDHLRINNRGEVSPCCVYNGKISDYNSTEQSLESLFHSNEMNSIRKRMLNGERPRGCKKCWDAEDGNIISHRLRHLSYKKQTMLTRGLDNPLLSSFDCASGNTCNFKCRICNVTDSSLYASEYEKFKNTPSGIDYYGKNFSTYQYDHYSQVIKELKTLVAKKQIVNIDFYGGEPLYNKNVLEFIHWAVDNQYSQNLRLHVNTNGSIFPEKLENCWKLFKHIDIQFSIDNINDRFQLERGSTWQIVDNNIRRFIDLKLPNATMGIMPVVSIMNILYLDEVADWAKNLGLDIQCVMLTQPEAFSIANLTPTAQQMCIDKCASSMHECLYSLVSYLQNIPTSNGNEFRAAVEHFDKIRNQDFRKTHYDIAKAMNLC